jgi:hypothetical protein
MTTRKTLSNAVPNLFIWGAGAGSIALLILEPTPLARRDILQHIPILVLFFVTKGIVLEESA